MAQMPGGEPRSVPDPDGEKYDEMIRQEVMRRQRAQTVATREPILDSALFRSPQNTLAHLDLTRSRLSTIKIGGKTCREIDNGIANVLVPYDPVSPAVRAEQRRAIERATYMAGNPFAGAAYGVATMANASPRGRETAMLAGGMVDAVILGASPRGAPMRSSTKPPQALLAPPPLKRPNFRYRELNAEGQATGVTATLTAPELGTGTRANQRLKPPGWQGDGNIYRESRAHLLGKQFGGTGDDLRNLVTMTRKANSPWMSRFEHELASRVRAGEIIDYSATPLYDKGVLPPSWVLLTAYGSRGAPSARIIQNPAGRRR